jgi:hypothetical protein
MIGKVLYARLFDRRNYQLANGNFIRGHIGADVIDSLYPGDGILHIHRAAHIAHKGFLRSQRLRCLHLLCPPKQRPNSCAAFAQRADNCLPCFTGCAGY